MSDASQNSSHEFDEKTTINDSVPNTSAHHNESDKHKSLSNLYSASQLRIDNWNKLKSQCSRIVTSQQRAIDERTDQYNNEIKKLKEEADVLLEQMSTIEMFWAFPGRVAFLRLKELLWASDAFKFDRVIKRIVRSLMSGSYRHQTIKLGLNSNNTNESEDSIDEQEVLKREADKPYFEILVVDNYNLQDDQYEKKRFTEIRRYNDSFTYEPVFVHSLEDAVAAVLINQNIQAVVIRYDFPLESKYGVLDVQGVFQFLGQPSMLEMLPENYAPMLAETINELRPELDLYLVTDRRVEELASSIKSVCRRIFYNQEDYLELHLNILRGIQSRYRTPFFNALQEYSKKPTGVFHAMPISRGKSIARSNWIKDMGDFYGMNMFLAETSATSGGLDSLLDPTGPLKEAQAQAARAFGARKTYFATNGTSTCNKIVVQALVKPGDIVLVDRDCHKSHHYGMVLSGAQVLYLSSYELSEYSMYGAVPLAEIKRQLLLLKKQGKLDRVKMLLLTNCTFDGLVYNVERYMQECLAIKPDLIFLWDEAWFAFARFTPEYRQRTGMFVANKLRNKYKSDAYRQEYAKYLEQAHDLDDDLSDEDIEILVKARLKPDPDAVRIRVYSTQSTHKTLTSLRQGSMIHIYDQDFSSKSEIAFSEAYMTHTSTSPNYQILASLDIGRRQVELEGFEFVQKQTEAALILRNQINSHPLLKKYFSVLDVENIIPKKYRESNGDYYSKESGYRERWVAWRNDEFVLDSTRLTLDISKTGVNGNTFKNEYLMEKYGIQINKTSRNTVLFMTNIGTTRSSVAYLIEVLVQIAEEFDSKIEDSSPAERQIYRDNVMQLSNSSVPLPHFSHFHPSFKIDPHSESGEGVIRAAYFLAYDERNYEYIPLNKLLELTKANEGSIVSASFVTPYPPGFPILVPGQVIMVDILEYLINLDVVEIHGYRPQLGVRVFKPEALERVHLGIQVS